MERKKTGLGLILTLALCLNAAVPAQAGSSRHFTDVPEDSYYYAAVDWADIRDITNGVTRTTFEPSSTCTRGQVCTFLWRAADRPEPKTQKCPFTDVSRDSAFYKAILWAYENGITNGTSKDKFSPSGACTRAHVLTFLWRAEGEPSAAYSELADERIPKGYWTDAYRWADGLKMLDQSGVAPDDPCPRADIVYYLYHSPDLHPDNGGSIPAEG